MQNSVGTLYIVATPIGNLEDMTFRAVRILKEADVIAAEDTRNTIKLLNHFDIHTPMIAYHKYNEKESTGNLIRQLREGQNIALVSDAGMPVISDPGFEIIRACREAGLSVTVVPGANAGLCGVVLSGMDCRRFSFYGFLGKSNKEFKQGISDVLSSPLPVVLYESPHRLQKLLASLAEQAPDRMISISREITKQYEETLNGSAVELSAHFEEKPPKGEFVLVVEGNPRGTVDETVIDLCQLPIAEHFQHYLDQAMAEKDAMKMVAKDRGISRRDVYQAIKV